MPALQLHGPPVVRFDDGRALPLAAREAALIAWLCLEGPTARARLAGLLWPAGTEAQARANLRQTLARLRRAGGELLEETDGVLRLAPALRLPEPPGDGTSATLLGPLEFDDAPELAAWLQARRDAERRRWHAERLAAMRAALRAVDLDAALDAADAVLALQPETEEAWRARMEVFHRRGDRAAALQAWDECRDALRAAFGVAPSPETRALGRRILDEPAAAPALTRSGLLPPQLRHPPRLVGRESALQTLLQAVALGHGALLLGPGGIGKSRLLAEVAHRAGPALSVGARPGDAVQPGALLERLVHGALRRFEPSLDAATRSELSRLLPAPALASTRSVDRGGTVAPPVRSAQERRLLLGAVVRLLEACRQAGMRLVIVDDLHFADAASLEALQVLLGAWRSLPPEAAAAPVLAARPEESGPAATGLLELLAASGRAVRVELGPLAAEAVLDLLGTLALDTEARAGGALAAGARAADAAALAGALHAQVGGNPAFLLETLKALWLDGSVGALDGAPAGPGGASAHWTPGMPLPVPPTLVEAVRRRLQRLSPDALQLAQLAAVAQSDFDLALAAAAFGRTPLALSPVLAELASAQVFDGHAFAHDLVADAVRQTLPAALPAALHALVAERLEARGGAAARIAHHLEAAGRPAAAVPFHLQAAAEARARWQMADAAASHAAAARALGAQAAADAAPATRRRALLAWRDAARCFQWAGDYAGMAAALDAAEALAVDGAERVLLGVLRTTLLFNTHRFPEAVEAGDALAPELLAHADALTPADLAYGVRALASVVPYGSDIGRALAVVARVGLRMGADVGEAATADPSRTESELVWRTARAALRHWNAEPAPAAADLDAAAALARAQDDPGALLLALNQRMRVRHALGDLAGTIADAEALLPLATRLDVGAMFRADVLHVLGMALVAAGRAAAGRARLGDLTGVLEAAGLAVPATLRTSLALAAMNVGRLDEAARWLDAPAGEATAPGAATALQQLAWNLTRARLALRLGDDAAPFVAAARAAGGLPPGLELQRAVALAALADPSRPDAASLGTMKALRERVAGLGMRGFGRTVALALAPVALAAGERALALECIEQALDAADAVDAWVDEPATLWFVAAPVLVAAGRPAQAADVAAAGRAWVQAGVAQWSDDTDRRAWRDGHPLHRALLGAA